MNKTTLTSQFSKPQLCFVVYIYLSLDENCSVQKPGHHEMMVLFFQFVLKICRSDYLSAVGPECGQTGSKMLRIVLRPFAKEHFFFWHLKSNCFTSWCRSSFKALLVSVAFPLIK